MRTIPRSWLAITVVLFIALLVGWWQWSKPGPPDNVTATVTPSTPAPADVKISAGQNFTFTLPVGWNAQPWQRESAVASSQSLSQELPRLRESINRFLSAFQSDSQVLIVQADELPNVHPQFLILSMPGHGLRLEQIADSLASETTYDRLIDTSLRADGQPILRVRSEQLTNLDSRALRPAEAAVIKHVRAGELVMIVKIDAVEALNPSTENSGMGEKVMDELLRSMQFIE